MRKNKMMRLASMLLVVTLLSTCVISGTFAKYTSQDSASDTARVAKWGVELQVAGALYEGSYKSDNTPVTWTDANAAGVSVNASADEDVVAPGTAGNTGLSFSLNGTPEVSGTVKTTIKYENIYLNTGKYGVMVKLGLITEAEYNTIMTAAGTDAEKKLYTESAGTYTVATAYSPSAEYYTVEDYVNLTENYYPVEYKMTGTTTKYNDSYTTATTADTLAGLVAAMATNLGTPDNSTPVEDGLTTKTYTQSFTPNQSLATVLKIEDQNITWKWDIENGADGEGDNACMYCKADTILGNLMSGSTAVVKLDTTAGTATAPTAAAGTSANDYNLETQFDINITVTQVD